MSRPRLRILHVGASDRGGGAERVAQDLSRTMREAGHDARLAVGRRLGPAEPHLLDLSEQAGRWRRFWSRRAERARNGGPARLYRGLAAPRGMLERLRGHEDFDHPASRRLLALDPAPDVFHLHNLHGGYFDLRLLPELGRSAAVFATLHDAWMITGHCAHPFDCPRWAHGCGRCPDLTIYPAVRRDATAFNWRRKREIYRASRLYLAAPSRWLLDLVERSMLAHGAAATRVVPNGVDLEIFRPGDRASARAGLGLAADERVVLFVAGGVSSGRFRDFETLNGALERVAARRSGGPVRFVALGQAPPGEPRVPVRFLSHRGDPGEVASIYRAADLFVHATRADNFPGVVLEAGACGIATVASAVGGIPEQIEAGRTGELVPPGDAEALSRTIERLLEDEGLRAALGRAAAARVSERHDLRRVAQDYLAWYAEAREAPRGLQVAGRRPSYSRASER